MSRGRSLSIGTSWVFSILILSAQEQAPPPFRSGTNLVLVDAYPQREGQIVEGLRPADFEVLEDGRPQKIEAFEFVRVDLNVPESSRRDPDGLREMYALVADPHYRAFVVYLDTLHTTVSGSNIIRAPLVDALNRIVGPSDLFGVMTPSMRPEQLSFGRRTLSIDEQLSKYWAWGLRDRLMTDPTDPVESELRMCFHTKQDGTDWLVPDGAAMRFLDDLLIERRRVGRTLQSLHDVVRYLGPLREARTTVLAVSDGWVLSGEIRRLVDEALTDGRMRRALRPMGGLAAALGRDPYADCLSELTRIADLDAAARFRDLVTDANRGNVSIYPIATNGLAVFDSSLGERISVNSSDRSGATLLGRDGARLTGRTQALRTIAENTGGIAIVNTNDLGVGVKRIVDDVSAYYLLGYTSTNPKTDGTFREIKVAMRPPGLTVRARRGYHAVAANDRASASAAVTSSPAVEAALSLLARRPASAEVFLYGSRSSTELTLVAEIPSARLEAGRWAQGADVQMMVTDATGAATGTVTGKIEPGARGALFRVSLAAGGRGPWRVNARVTAPGERLEEIATIQPDAPGSLLGAPLVYRAAPGPRSPLRPVADFQFRRTERIHVEWPALKVLDQRQARVLGKNGQPLALAANVTEREVNGENQLAADVNLAPLAPGDYVIEVKAGSGSELETKLIAIRVVP